MSGSPADMAARIRVILPEGWFADTTTVLNGLLEGIGAAWACIYTLIQFVVLQTRVGTATGPFLDMVSTDFFGNTLPRLGSEQDSHFRGRVKNELLRPRGTRGAVMLALTELTGRPPTIFEPGLTSDTGGYATGGVGYCVGGGWGNLALPFQVFITAYRSQGGGIPLLAGYGTGGVPVYGSFAMQPPEINDADIYAAIPPLMPAATIAWTRLSN